MSVSLVLPARSDEAEDAYVAAWADSNEVDGLVDVIGEAMDARRPRLAARLVQLLPDKVEIEPGSAIERAQGAARLLVVDTRNIDLFNALDEAWREVRRKRMRRMITRQRLVGRGEQWTVPRTGRNPRKR